MVKHNQTIRREIADELFEYVWLFYGIGTWRANFRLITIKRTFQIEAFDHTKPISDLLAVT